MTTTPETRVLTWPPVKKAIWDVLMETKLNVGYVAAEPLTDKLFAAVLAAAPATPAPEPVGPLISFDVREPYYLASCNHCGWVGSSEHCGTDDGGDDSSVYCPRCHASGADCGKVAARVATPPAPVAASAVDGLRTALEAAGEVLADIVHASNIPGDFVAWAAKRASEVLPDVRKALATTPPSDDSKAGALDCIDPMPRVKALEFKRRNRAPNDLGANSTVGRYDVGIVRGGFTAIRRDGDGDHMLIEGATEAAAIDACNADASCRVLACLEPGQGWRTMDSAPKDGTRIILKAVTFGWSSDICQHVATGDKAVEARWSKDLSGTGEAAWREWCGNDRTFSSDGPLVALGWLPLPPPPPPAAEGSR